MTTSSIFQLALHENIQRTLKSCSNASAIGVSFSVEFKITTTEADDADDADDDEEAVAIIIFAM
jgi:hypothetical protein